jgi:hypothetical protein
MRKTGIIIALLASILLVGCTALEKKQQAGAAVELNGQYLYRSTLDSLTLGLDPEDSTRVVQQYVSQWAKDILVYDNAKARPNNDIERLVEDYRRALYVHAYEEYLVERRMPKTVADSTVAQLYAQMPDRFTLDESIIKGMLVVIPNDAPKIDKLRGWMTKTEMDAIEKYVYQNASGYELFTDKWLTTTDLLAKIPVERAELETRLKAKNQIEVADTLKTYLLQVTDKHLRGEQMPMEYARPQIEKMVLSARQVEFLTKERERLYNEAIQNQKIKFYE